MADYPTLSPDHDLWLTQLRVAAETGALNEATDREMMTHGVRLAPDQQELESLMFMYYHDSDPEYVALMRNEPDQLVSRLVLKREGFANDPFELMLAGWVHTGIPLERRFEVQRKFAEKDGIDFGNGDTMTSLICRAWMMTDLPEPTRVACAAELLKKLPTFGEYEDVRKTTLETLTDAPGYESLVEALRGDK